MANQEGFHPSAFNTGSPSSKKPDEIVSLDSTSSETHKSLGRNHWYIIRFALIQQVIILIVSFLVLDGGDTYRLCLISVVMAWVPNLIILHWRKSTKGYLLTTIDELIIKYDFWPCFLLMIFLYSSNMLPESFYFSNRVKKSNPPPVTRMIHTELKLRLSQRSCS